MAWILAAILTCGHSQSQPVYKTLAVWSVVKPIGVWLSALLVRHQFTTTILVLFYLSKIKTSDYSSDIGRNHRYIHGYIIALLIACNADLSYSASVVSSEKNYFVDNM